MVDIETMAGYNNVMEIKPSPSGSREEELCGRLLLALDMFHSGLSLMRENLRRRHPELSVESLEEKLTEWLVDRPLDAPGTVVKGLA